MSNGDHDPSNGYEAIAEEFMAVRSNSGRDFIDRWAKTLPERSSLLDLGAGHGEPVTRAIVGAGHTVSAIDASPKMAAALRATWPEIRVACEPVETSNFFGDTFDAALAIGLIFLFPENRQGFVINRGASALRPGGRLLFSAPKQKGGWNDLLTNQPSWSLGLDGYRDAIRDAGLTPITEHEDEQNTHYYEARKP